MDHIENMKLIRGNSAAGIHMILLEDGRWSINITIIQKKKNLIYITHNFTDIPSVNDAAEKLDVNCPIVLSVEGKGIIHKRINSTDNVHLVQQVFPNAQPKEFYVQSEVISEDHRMISLISRDTIRDIIVNFTNKGYHIYHVFLGPFSLNGLCSSFDQKSNEYFIGNYTLLRDQDKIIQLEMIADSAAQTPYSIANEEIASDSLIPYSNAVSFIMNSDPGLIYSEDICRLNREGFIYKKLFQMTGIGMVIILFLILLINFLLFDKYNKKYAYVNQQFKTDLELVNKVDSMKAALRFKEKLIEENGLMTSSRYSYYADRVASLVPYQIALTKLEINPLITQMKSDKELIFKQNIILINGKCISGLILDEWLNTLKNEMWIKHMEVLQYQQDNRGTLGNFAIQITY